MNLATRSAKDDYCFATIAARFTMLDLLRAPSFLPTCILAGVGVIFLVLAAVLPAIQMCALVGGSAVAIGLVLARLRREEEASGTLATPSHTEG